MIFSIISGILLALSFPVFNFGILAWVALVPFYLAPKRAKNRKEALMSGCVFGLVFFGIHLFWVNSLIQFAGWVAVLGWLGFVLLQTIYILLFCLIAQAVKDRQSAMILAFAWVGIEWFRSLGPFGVTVGVVGYSQAGFLPLIQIARYTLVFGVSFLPVFFSFSLAEWFINRKQWKPLAFSILLVSLSFLYGTAVLWSHPIDSSFGRKIALIQPNISQNEKMSAEKVPAVFSVHEQLTRQAAKEKPEIIIWPETSIFTFLLRDPLYFPRVQALAKQTGAWLVIGTPHFADDRKIYNSIAAVSPSGRVVSRYDKQQLVPFGEYLPFRSLLFPLFQGSGFFDSEFDSNPQPSLLLVGKDKIAAAICFESTLPQLIKNRVAADVRMILTVTNDAWFGDSSAPYFHLNCGIFRAIENRKYFLQAGNNDISAVIDPWGRVVKRTKLNQRSLLFVQINGSQSR